MTARSAVAAMTAYTLELRVAATKLNQNEGPSDFPLPLKKQVLDAMAAQPWNRYPEFESLTLRTALAHSYDLKPENILVGNGSNELLAATISTFVGPGTPVVIPRPSFTLYEKLVTIAGGSPVFVDIDPASPELPAEQMIRVAAGFSPPSLVIACSPNNPTGGALPGRSIEALLGTGATVLLDRAYGDFALDSLPAIDDRLVTFSTFSKAWGLAALRIGWLATSATTAREIRKVKLPYNLNVFSETAAVVALANPAMRDETVSRAIAERERVAGELRALPGIEGFPSVANFIAFRIPDARQVFEALCSRGILIRDISSYPGLQSCLRVSIGTADQNDRFIEAMKEIA